VERQGIHELSAAYALHALDAQEERAFEEHLAHCDGCREDVTSFQETAAALAYEAEAPAPPRALKNRILSRARAEGATVIPLRRRWGFPAAAAAAVAASFAAVGLGLWATNLSSQLDEEREASRSAAEVVALSGARGSLVVTPAGDAALIVRGLASAPEGKTYEAWVIHADTTRPAGIFAGGGEPTAFALTRRVPAGATVAVTLEAAGGVDEPTTDPLFSAKRA
jgi:anti-sigma-K factor RskA